LPAGIVSRHDTKVEDATCLEESRKVQRKLKISSSEKQGRIMIRS